LLFIRVNKIINRIVLCDNKEVNEIKYQIRGANLPVLDMQLKEGESVFTEAGGMAWMTENISMKSGMKGGLKNSLKKMLSGESLFMVDYTCDESMGSIAFCTEFPGKILPFKLKENESLICQRDAFMVAETSVNLEMEFTKKIGVGFFGGEGFFLQKITGPGKAFLEISGEVTEYELDKGKKLKIDPGYIAAFEPTVNYHIDRVKGFKNILFGGEGLFLATLEGPGKVWLQSMPLANLAWRLSAYLPTRE